MVLSKDTHYLWPEVEAWTAVGLESLLITINEEIRTVARAKRSRKLFCLAFMYLGYHLQWTACQVGEFFEGLFAFKFLTIRGNPSGIAVYAFVKA